MILSMTVAKMEGLDSSKCRHHTLDVVLLEKDPILVAVEDEIRNDLARVGITVRSRFVDRETYGEMMINGDYHMFFSRTWGAPYDPHSYAMSWAVPSNAEFAALANLTFTTREALLEKVAAAQIEMDDEKVSAMWRNILEEVHREAVQLPLWGERIPYVVNRRLTGSTGPTPHPA